MTDVLTELRNELARDRQLAVDAAARIAAGEPIATIESEALDALELWIGFEMQDRAVRCNDRQQLIDIYPF